MGLDEDKNNTTYGQPTNITRRLYIVYATVNKTRADTTQAYLIDSNRNRPIKHNSKLVPLSLLG